MLKDRPNGFDLSVFQRQLTKLCWTSELVGHTKPYLADFDLGGYMAVLINRDSRYRRPMSVDLKKSSHLTKYTYAQATYFLSKFGNNSSNSEWLKVFSDAEVPASIADNPLH